MHIDNAFQFSFVVKISFLVERSVRSMATEILTG